MLSTCEFIQLDAQDVKFTCLVMWFREHTTFLNLEWSFLVNMRFRMDTLKKLKGFNLNLRNRTK